MKIVRIASLVVLVLSVFVSIDMGLNVMALAVPEMQDGIGYNSLLQSVFGLLESMGVDTAMEFRSAFSVSIWVSFALFVVNCALCVMAMCERKKLRYHI